MAIPQESPRRTLDEKALVRAALPPRHQSRGEKESVEEEMETETGSGPDGTESATRRDAHVEHHA